MHVRYCEGHASSEVPGSERGVLQTDTLLRVQTRFWKLDAGLAARVRRAIRKSSQE